jgi:hypothetical protein
MFSLEVVQMPKLTANFVAFSTRFLPDLSLTNPVSPLRTAYMPSPLRGQDFLTCSGCSLLGAYRMPHSFFFFSLIALPVFTTELGHLGEGNLIFYKCIHTANSDTLEIHSDILNK